MPTTFTATAYARPGRAVHAGVNSVTVEFDSGGATVSGTASGATTVYMAKIPHGATILDVFGSHNIAADTCPTDVGIGSSVSAFISGATKAAITRAAVIANIPYRVSVSDDATERFLPLKVTATPGTAAVNLIAKYTVLYTMDA